MFEVILGYSDKNQDLITCRNDYFASYTSRKSINMKNKNWLIIEKKYHKMWKTETLLNKSLVLKMLG